MKIAKISPFTGKMNIRDIPITAQEYFEYQRSNKPIQNILPQLSSDDREFLMTGYTPDDWDTMMKEDN